MKKELDYWRTSAPIYSEEEWLAMLKENDCFTTVLHEALYTLIFELGGKGSAMQISEITGRSRQEYNKAPWRTIERLRKHGYSIAADIRNSNGKERYWGHFFLGYYDNKSFIWEVKDTLHDAFIKYTAMSDGVDTLDLNDEKTDEKTVEDETAEGAKRQRIHFQIERNSVIVNSAKKKFLKKNGTLFCEVCEFSFEKMYGIEYIEAHHILPLYKGERKTGEKDLMMLCANCHRAVHNARWSEQPIDSFFEYIRKK